MRSHRSVFALFAVITTLLACQVAPGQPTPRPETASTPVAVAAEPSATSGSEAENSTAEATTAVEPTPVPDGPDVSWIFDIPAEPVEVDVVLDTSLGVEALIPLEGGSLSVTGADGTLYTLDIPEGALLNPATIGMTPVSSLSGMPFGGGQTYAVQFSPEGLYFYSDAILTITPAEAIPLEEQLVFGYEASGHDPILAMPVVDSEEIQIRVQHFSGNGVTRGLLADQEPARERVGGSAKRRLSNAVSEQLIRQRQRQDGDLSVFKAALEQYEAEVVRPRVAAAGDSCAAGLVAVQTVLGYKRMLSLLGLPGGEGGHPLADYPGLLRKATQVCVVEEFELCVEEHIIHRMVPVWLGLARQYELLEKPPDSGAIKEARDLAVACLTFRLNFKSTGTLNLVGAGYESTVTSEVMLHFNPDELTIKGEAPLVNEDFEFFPPPDCSATSIPGDGTFEAFKLIIRDEPDGQYGHVSDFDFYYMPGDSSESASYTCDFPGGGHTEQSLPAFPAWTSAFLATHEAELVTESAQGGGFLAVDWEIFGDEYFAKKEWIKEAGDIVEAGTFKLYHTPGE